MSSYYEEIYEQFKTACWIDDYAVDHWEPGLEHEIIVYMKNGKVLCFDNNTKSSGLIHEHETDEYGDFVLSDDEYREAFSRKLRRIMLSRNMTRKQLAEATGINAGTLSHYMTGRNLPDMRNTRRICHALNCDFFELTEVQ